VETIAIKLLKTNYSACWYVVTIFAHHNMFKYKQILLS